MDDQEFELLTLKESFRCEISLCRTKFPFARTTIRILIARLKAVEEESDRLEVLKEKLEEVATEYFKDIPQQMLLMRYCDDKEKYRVHLHEKSLCFLTGSGYVKIDSQMLFRDHFGRLPVEDDEYLKSVGFPSLPERKGKSCFSCFIIRKNRNLYVTPYRQDTMQHTYLTFGKDVLCAGLLFLADGKIHYIDNRSGHYLSTPKHLKIFFDFVNKNRGANLLKDYFCKDFSFSAEIFSMFPLEVIAKKQFGINFYKFGEKTQVELLAERGIRREISKLAQEQHL